MATSVQTFLKAAALLVALLGAVVQSYEPDPEVDDFGCPRVCICNSYGAMGVKVTCHDFNSQMLFDDTVSQFELTHVAGNGPITLQDDVFSKAQLKSVNIIRITSSHLQNVSQHAFRGLLSLNVLNLSSNSLQNIHPDTFASNQQLRTLSLRGNPLLLPHDASTLFLNTPTLTFLDLSRCNITDLHSSVFSHLTTLEVLLLASNDIETIKSDTFAHLDMLQDLDLADNKIRKLDPHAFDNNTELTSLYLNDNPLTSMEGVCAPNVLHLEMINTQLTSINAKTFLGFPNVVNLNLKGNKIVYIDENAFAHMQELLYVDLSGNNLKGSLANGVFSKNHKLETLSLAENPNMKSLPAFGFQGKFSELYKLDLHRCGLMFLDRYSFRGMYHLTTLNLSSNAIEELRFGLLPPSLHFVDLSWNFIADMDRIQFPLDTMVRRLFLQGNPLIELNALALSTVPLLTYLDASHCRLESLWGDRAPEMTFPRIETLVVSHNRLHRVAPADLDVIGNLREIDLADNPLRCDKTFTALIEWLKQRGVVAMSWQRIVQRSRSAPLLAEEVAFDVDELSDAMGWNLFAGRTCTGRTTKKSSRTLLPPLVAAHHLPHETPSAPVPLITEPTPVATPDEVQVGAELRVWTVVLTAVACLGVAVLAGATVVAVMRWSRERFIYSRNMHLRRAVAARCLTKSYEQLREERSTPSTPMVPRTYEQADPQPEARHVTYFSSQFHHSNIVPQSV